jgi:HK97 family phage major capsid protein
MTKEELRAAIAAKLAPARAIAEQAEKENRQFTPAERETITRAVAEAEPFKEQLKAVEADKKMRDSLSSIEDGIGVDLNDDGRGRKSAGGLLIPGAKTIGELYWESEAHKRLLSSSPGGRFSEKQRVQGDPVGFKTLFNKPGFKTLVTGASDTSGGALVVNDWLGMQVGLGAFQRPLTIRDIVTNGTTTSDTVEYVRVTSVTNNAGPVAESTATADPGAMTAANGVKPESALAMQKINETVKTIAHWLPATKRALSDAGQVRTLIDQFLRYGIEEELEDQMISGAGTGENFTGIANVSGIQAQAWDTNILTTTRKARTKVRTVGRSIPTAYVLNPADWEIIDLLQDNEARYYFGGPARQGQPTLWGLPVIESEAVPAGVGYVADWRKAVLWDREDASITVSDSHANFFIRNMVAFLGEMRVAFGVLQPNAFVQMDLTA